MDHPRYQIRAAPAREIYHETEMWVKSWEKHCETRKEAERALADMVAAQARGLLTDPKAPDPLGACGSRR